MVVDSSALLAILFKEPERDAFASAIAGAGAGTRLVSSVNALEAAIVVSARKDPSGVRELNLDAYKRYARELKLDVARFEKDLGGPRERSRSSRRRSTPS